MTDKRLEELKKEIGETFFKYVGNAEDIEQHEELDDIGVDLIDLITAEQQRRSVRSEDVQRAIKDLNKGKKLNQENLKAENFEDVYLYRLDEETLDLAILALEAYQPWISVEDGKYPTGVYLPVLRFDGINYYEDFAYYSKKRKAWIIQENESEYSIDNVAYYFILPQPPKGEANG